MAIKRTNEGAQTMRAVCVVVFTVAPMPRSLVAQTFGGETLPAYYDVRNGNLTIDTTNVTGGVSIAYSFRAPGGAFRPENFTPFMNTRFASAGSLGVIETNLEGIVGGVYSLGNILPEGLTEEELSFTYFGVNDRSGHEGDPGNPDRMYYAAGPLGSGWYHLFEPVYAPSLFPALNDTSSVGLPEIDRWASEVSLQYNAMSGELILDSRGPTGGTIWSYEIRLIDELFNVDAFTPATDGLLAGTDGSRITEVGFHGISEGLYSLGPVLPFGLTEGEFSSVIRSARFLAEPGHDATAFEISVSGLDMSLTYVVPEPSGAFLGMVAILPLLLCRPFAFSFDGTEHVVNELTSGSGVPQVSEYEPAYVLAE